jgi:hypothetical protein
MARSTRAPPWQTMTLAYAGCSRSLTPSDMRVYPRQEFFRDEWFGDKVVCPGFETGASGCSICLSAQQQHGHVAETGIRPKSATDLQSVPTHQTDVEQHDIGYLRSYQRINIVSIGRCLQLDVAARKGIGERPGDAWLVIDEQDARHARMVSAPERLFRDG